MTGRQNVSPGITVTEAEILHFLASGYGEGTTLAHDIACEVGVSPKGIGARLKSLVDRGLVYGRYYPDLRLNGWAISDAGYDLLQQTVRTV